MAAVDAAVEVAAYQAEDIPIVVVEEVFKLIYKYLR
jgi:hypothetical protein